MIPNGPRTEVGFSLAAGGPGLPLQQVSKTGADRVPETRRGLKLSLELDRQSYALGDTPVMSISLKNIGKETISLYENMGWGESSSLVLMVTDNLGHALKKTFIEDARDRPPYFAEDFMKIKAGHAFTFKRALLLDREGVTSPGSYVVTVFFHSPVTRKSAPEKSNVWTREEGELHSTPITFTVK
jgi:hypothetical protein